MCTAVAYKTKSHYFGRNLDLEYSYDESVTIVPRNYMFKFKRAEAISTHYAMIGMAYVVDEYPLFYDATNEAGLSMAGLNFPQNAYYEECRVGGEVHEISPFEFIPWILAQCTNISEVRRLLASTVLVAIHFSEKLSLSPLHWIISDRNESIVVEPLKEGLKVYDNPVEVLTNNPTFDWHMMNLNNYVNLTTGEPEGGKWLDVEFNCYSRGMGAIGLPGDWSSSSRFVRAVYVRNNSVSGESEQESVSQFMHILDSVAMSRGSVRLENDKYEITVYSSCCNTDTGTYYYKTYNDCRVKAVDMRGEDLEGSRLIKFSVSM